VSYLEAKVEGQSDSVHGVKEALATLDARVERSFEAVDRRFDAFDRRFDAIDRRFEAIDRRFEAVDRRFEALDQKVDRHFLWMVGLQVTTIMTVIGAIVAAVLAR
jgi:hypothetical protein